MDRHRNRHHHLTAALAAGASALVCLAACVGADAATAPVRLSARAPDVSGYAGPVGAGADLAAGKLYVAEVSGSFSYFAADMYTDPHGPWDVLCGDPLSGPEGPLGADAEFIFARPWTSPCPASLPTHWSNFELSTTAGVYRHPEILGGPLAVPTADHEYDFPLLGSGSEPTFRLHDDPEGHPATADNYGALAITVRAAAAADCAGGGYAAFGEASEAACLAALPSEPTTVTTPPAGGAEPASGVLGVTIRSAKQCTSGRSFTIHVQNARRLGLVSAVVTVNGRDRRTLRGRSLSTVIDLKGLPKGAVTVEIVARRRDGRTVRGKRVYHPCVARRSSGAPVRL
jgi:hypothetical protein